MTGLFLCFHARLLDELCEYLGIIICEIGEELSVDRNARFSECSDEPRIGRAILAGRRIDANNPERTEIAFACAAIAERILATFIDMMLCYGNNITAHSPIAFGGFKDFLFSALGSRKVFSSWHGIFSDFCSSRRP
jgi:hypothetical protein